MSRISKLVKYAFDNYPVIINSVIYGTLYVGAEFSQQTFTKKVMANNPEPYDVASLGRLAVFGTGIGGPLLTVWYTWLDKTFKGTTFKIITKKLLLDQFLFTPQLYIIFFVSMSIMEQKSDLLEECRQKIIPTFKTSCLFWLPVQTINFLIIPARFRVSYVGTASFAWVNILCWIKSQDFTKIETQVENTQEV